MIYGPASVPVAIDVAAFAVENAFEASYDAPGRTVALVNIGAQVVSINIIANGVPCFTRDITTAGNQYRGRSEGALDQLRRGQRIKLGGRRTDSQDVVPQEVEQAVQSVTETVIGEISRSLDFYGATSADSRIEKVYLAGGASKVSGFAKSFHERTGLAVAALNPLARMIPSNRFEADYLDDLAPTLGVGVGLALRSEGGR